MNKDVSADDESKTTIGTKSKVRIEVVVVIGGLLLWGGWASSELNTIKASQFQYGQIAAKIQSEIAVLNFRMDQLEKRGSEPMQTLQKAIDELRFKLDAHMGIGATKATP